MSLVKSVYEEETGLRVEEEFRFCPTRRWRADFAIPSLKILIEQEGGIWQYGRHNHAASMIADMEKYNTAASMGYLLLRFTPTDILKSPAIELVRKAIAYQQAHIKTE